MENEEKIIQADFAEVLIDGNEGINPKFEQGIVDGNSDVLVVSDKSILKLGNHILYSVQILRGGII